MKRAILATITIIVLIFSAGIIIFINNKADQPKQIEYSYTIINQYPHSTSAFTEGLVFQDGFLYESTGPYLTSQSALRKIDLATGTVLQEHMTPSQYFDEGITILDGKIVQLTWQNHLGFVYNQTTFTIIQNFTYPTEGWGITNDGKELIMSDGTQHIYFLNATTYQQTRTITVSDANGLVMNINELEYIDGLIYANIWKTEKIAIIKPENGDVVGYMDLTGLDNLQTDNPDIVPNGIAYNPQNGTLLVTGKMWSHIFEIKISPQKIT